MQVLTQHGHGFDTVNQVADVAAFSVERALKLLRGAMPSPSLPLAEGGQYKFIGPVDDSPPASSGDIEFRAAPKDPAEEGERDEPEPERDDDGSVRWLL